MSNPHMNDVQGKVAFVTGAASGIGLGIVRAFTRAGMQVMMADIEAPVLEQAADQLSSEGASVATIVCDVSDLDALHAAAAHTLATFDKVHVVCNNAGVSSGGLIEDCTSDDWAWVTGVNFLGVVHGCQAFVPHLKRQGEGGHIVNTASMAGILGGMAGWGPYNSTKFAVVGLTEVIRQEGREAGYSASVLCPGGVNTNIFDAPRNRPARFGAQTSAVAYTGSADDVSNALDPNVVGELVLEAILANRLYIFTDPRFRTMVERRFSRMCDDIDWAAGSQALTRAHAPGATPG